MTQQTKTTYVPGEFYTETTLKMAPDGTIEAQVKRYPQGLFELLQAIHETEGSRVPQTNGTITKITRDGKVTIESDEETTIVDSDAKKVSRVHSVTGKRPSALREESDDGIIAPAKIARVPVKVTPTTPWAPKKNAAAVFAASEMRSRVYKGPMRQPDFGESFSKRNVIGRFLNEVVDEIVSGQNDIKLSELYKLFELYVSKNSITYGSSDDPSMYKWAKFRSELSSAGIRTVVKQQVTGHPNVTGRSIMYAGGVVLKPSALKLLQ